MAAEVVELIRPLSQSIEALRKENAEYNQVQKVTHRGCWAHARRKWREAMPNGTTVKTSKAAVRFQYCTKLFSLEKKCVYADGKGQWN